MSPLPPAGSGASRWLGRRLVFALVAGVAVLVGLGLWADALAEPVVRAGVPTGSVTPPPPKPTPTRTAASQTPTPSSSPTTKPTTTTSSKPKPSASPAKDAGTFSTSTLARKSVSGTGRRHTFIVKVEKAAKLDANEVAGEIADVLNEPRSWAGSGTVRFALV